MVRSNFKLMTLPTKISFKDMLFAPVYILHKLTWKFVLHERGRRSLCPA